MWSNLCLRRLLSLQFGRWIWKRIELEQSTQVNVQTSWGVVILVRDGKSPSLADTWTFVAGQKEHVASRVTVSLARTSWWLPTVLPGWRCSENSCGLDRHSQMCNPEVIRFTQRTEGVVRVRVTHLNWELTARWMQGLVSSVTSSLSRVLLESQSADREVDRGPLVEGVGVLAVWGGVGLRGAPQPPMVAGAASPCTVAGGTAGSPCHCRLSTLLSD